MRGAEMGAISPGTIEATLIVGVFVLVVGALLVGLSPRGQRTHVAGCVAGAIGALLSWLVLFRILFGVAA